MFFFVEIKFHIFITFLITIFVNNNLTYSLDLSALFVKPEPTEPFFKAEIDLGSIDIDNEKCLKAITPYLQQCRDIYHEKITNVAIEFGDNLQSESVKKVSCCGIWEAKQCAINAANNLDICQNISSLYEKLPFEPKIRANVFDKCSEYRENSAICKPNISSSLFSLHSLIIILIIILSITICALILIKYFKKDRWFNGEFNHKTSNQSIKMNHFV